MDKDRAKGKTNDIKGRAKRQAGEWTGDKDLEKEGTKDQVEGKAQNTLGKAKDFGRDVKKDAEREFGDHKDKDEAA